MSFFVSGDGEEGDDDGDDGDDGVDAEPEVEPDAEPEAEPLAPPGALELEDGDEEDGLLEEVPLFFDASSPQAARVSAAAAAINRALVIPVPLRG